MVVGVVDDEGGKEECLKGKSNLALGVADLVNVCGCAGDDAGTSG